MLSLRKDSLATVIVGKRENRTFLYHFDLSSVKQDPMIMQVQPYQVNYLWKI